MSKKMEGVREYSAGYDVYTCVLNGRLCIEAYGKASLGPGDAHDVTHVDLEDLLHWAWREHADLVRRAMPIQGEHAERIVIDDASADAFEEKLAMPPVPNEKLRELFKDKRARSQYAYRLADNLRHHASMPSFQDGNERDHSDARNMVFELAVVLGVNYLANPNKLTAPEAVFGLLGWLTSRETPITLGAKHYAGPAVDAAAAFINANELGECRPTWSNLLKHPKEPAAFATMSSAVRDMIAEHEVREAFASSALASWVLDGVPRDPEASTRQFLDAVKRTREGKDVDPFKIVQDVKSPDPDRFAMGLKDRVRTDAPVRFGVGSRVVDPTTESMAERQRYVEHLERELKDARNALATLKIATARVDPRDVPRLFMRSCVHCGHSHYFETDLDDTDECAECRNEMEPVARPVKAVDVRAMLAERATLRSHLDLAKNTLSAIEDRGSALAVENQKLHADIVADRKTHAQNMGELACTARDALDRANRVEHDLRMTEAKYDEATQTIAQLRGELATPHEEKESDSRHALRGARTREDAYANVISRLRDVVRETVPGLDEYTDEHSWDLVEQVTRIVGELKATEETATGFQSMINKVRGELELAKIQMLDGESIVKLSRRVVQALNATDDALDVERAKDIVAAMKDCAHPFVGRLHHCVLCQKEVSDECHIPITKNLMAAVDAMRLERDQARQETKLVARQAEIVGAELGQLQKHVLDLNRQLEVGKEFVADVKHAVANGQDDAKALAEANARLEAVQRDSNSTLNDNRLVRHVLNNVRQLCKLEVEHAEKDKDTVNETHTQSARATMCREVLAVLDFARHPNIDRDLVVDKNGDFVAGAFELKADASAMARMVERMTPEQRTRFAMGGGSGGGGASGGYVEMTLPFMFEPLKTSHLLPYNPDHMSPNTVDPDYSKMSTGEMLEYCGDNGSRWAAACVQLVGVSSFSYGTMIGWFANAIETACDKRARERKSNVGPDIPTFNHTRGDGPYSPCIICLSLMDRDQLFALAKDNERTIAELRADKAAEHGDWEYLQWDGDVYTTYGRRLRVPGGWLYQFSGPEGRGESYPEFKQTAFVPQP